LVGRRNFRHPVFENKFFSFFRRLLEIMATDLLFRRHMCRTI